MIKMKSNEDAIMLWKPNCKYCLFIYKSDLVRNCWTKNFLWFKNSCVLFKRIQFYWS